MQNITQTKPTATVEKLERARVALRNIARDVQVTEGRLLDFETADAMQRTLNATMRELEELTITISVLERRTTNHV
jgi:anti-sigma regulatory factor (Ser/Thr protein kinase)